MESSQKVPLPVAPISLDTKASTQAENLVEPSQSRFGIGSVLLLAWGVGMIVYYFAAPAPTGGLYRGNPGAYELGRDIGLYMGAVLTAYALYRLATPSLAQSSAKTHPWHGPRVGPRIVFLDGSAVGLFGDGENPFGIHGSIHQKGESIMLVSNGDMSVNEARAAEGSEVKLKHLDKLRIGSRPGTRCTVHLD